MAGNNIYVQGSYIDIHDNEIVNLNVDKAQVMMGQAAKQEASWPQELKTERAMVYWRRLQEAGFVNEDFSRADMSRIQAMHIAKKFAFAIGLSSTWKPFETGWGINNLAQEQYQKKDECKKIPRKDEIDRIFAT